MECKRIEEIILTDYTDGKLSGQMFKDVEAHLASCSRCRALASELVRLRTDLRKAGRMTPPSRVWETVRAGVAGEPAGGVFAQNFLRSVRLLSVRLRPAVVAATAAALILVVLTMARLMPQKEMLVVPVAQDEALSLITLDEDRNGADYDLGTPAEDYFL